MLEKSRLASDLKRVFHGLRDCQELAVLINGWIHLKILVHPVRSHMTHDRICEPGGCYYYFFSRGSRSLRRILLSGSGPIKPFCSCRMRQGRTATGLLCNGAAEERKSPLHLSGQSPSATAQRRIPPAERADSGRQPVEDLPGVILCRLRHTLPWA
jgi:hypothetical protein